MRHIVLMPVEVLRSLGGNLTALAKLVETQMPAYEQVGTTIPLLQLAQAGLPDADAQEAAMLALMTATRDRLDVIEALLAAIIQGVQIIVKGAPQRSRPADRLHRRAAGAAAAARAFRRDLCHPYAALRPASMRRFASTPTTRRRRIPWSTSGTRRASTGKIAEDEYARFIRSQLRLDTGLVVEQTTELTAVAAWRIKRGDSLAEALKYASYRLKIDTAITNNQPVEAADAAKILAEDPTLTDTVRAAYVRHLLAFALVLDEIEHADKLAVVVRGQPDLESVILQQMSEALDRGQSGSRLSHAGALALEPDGL